MIGHAILWLVFAREAFFQDHLTQYIEVYRAEARIRAQQAPRPNAPPKSEYRDSEDVEIDRSKAVTAFVDSEKFRPLMVVQLLLFQTTNLLAPAYFAFVTHKLRYARSRAPIHAMVVYFSFAFIPAIAMPFASIFFYSMFHFAMFGLWYPLVIAVMIYSAQDRLEAQPERLGADRKRQRGVPRSTTRQ